MRVGAGMALLERREQVEIKRVQLAIPADALDMLEKYAAYLNRDKSEVVAAAIKHAVSLDHEFCRGQGLAPPGARRARRAVEHTEAAS